MTTVSTQSTPHPRAKITPAAKSPCEVARELRDQALQQSSAAPSATRSANDAAGHAVHIFNRELKLDAATVFTDSESASSRLRLRLSLSRKQTWCEGKLRHAGMAFHYVRGLVRHGNITILPVKGTESCSGTLNKGYDTTPARVKEFNKLSRICHGFRHDIY